MTIITGGQAVIKGGLIHARIYDQEGQLQPLLLKDITDNQHFVAWLQAHDRYTLGEKSHG